MKNKKQLLAVFCTSCALVFSGYWLAQLYLGPTVVGYRISRDKLVQTVTVEGLVTLPENIVVSSNTGGKIAAINVTVGQSVTAGQILMTLENNINHAALEKARIETLRAEACFRKISELTQAGSRESVQRAKNNLEAVQKQITRISALSSKGFASAEQKSEAQRNLAIAQSQLSTSTFQAKANRAKGSDFAFAELALNKARALERKVKTRAAERQLLAEVDGVVLSCKLAKGSLIKPHSILMVISPVGKAQLLAHLDRKITSEIKLGQQARVMADGHPDQYFNAEFSQIDNVQDEKQAKVDVQLQVVNAPKILAQDMPVTLKFELLRKDTALSLAAEDIRNAEGAEPWVMVAENGRTLRKSVKLGSRGNGKVEVVQGLQEGDFVIPAAAFDIEAGKRVRLARN